MIERIGTILDYWFEGVDDSTLISNKELPFRKWFLKDTKLDEDIRQEFESDLLKASEGKYVEWENSAQGVMALVILYDQFTRNMYRDTDRMYAYDSVAVELVLKNIKEKKDLDLMLIERAFFYLPLMHSEDQKLQGFSVECFTKLLEVSKALNPANTHYYMNSLRHAKEHQMAVNKFGRFVHRDVLLGRVSDKV